MRGGISGVTIRMIHVRGLISPLIAVHELPSRMMSEKVPTSPSEWRAKLGEVCTVRGLRDFG